MPDVRPRALVRGLRGRLTLGVLIVLAGVLAVAGATLSHYVDRSEREALDDRLRKTAELSRAAALAAVERELPANDRRLDAVLSATGTSLRLLLGRSVLLDTGAPPPRRPPPGLGFKSYAAGGRSYRSYTVRLRDPALGGLARLQLTTPLTTVEQRQHDLDRRLALVGLLALLVAGVGVSLAADLVLRPLRRLREVAAGVATTEDLERRVPEDGGAEELRSLARSVNAMLARLGRSAADRERALEATRRFAADAGHELRTPLTSVSATLSALARHPDLPADRRAALLRDATDEHARLVELLDGLQALARGDAAPLEPTDVDLAELADGALAAAGSRHPEVEWAPELPDDPVVVRGWEPGLRLLVANLVENAARHGGHDGGRVAVAVEPPVDGRGAVLRVEDDGPGIPEADRARIFEPFTRLAPDRPGSGLGLALVAQQARHHGAELTVGESALGGAAFTVRFPGA